MNTLVTELQSLWQTQIPLAAAIGIEIVRFDDDELLIQAGLAPNVNVHGTAFAGSLYSVCALAGWGMIWLQLRARGIDAHIVLSEGRIEYWRPVAETIACRCRFDASNQAANVEQLEKTGSGLFPLVCGIDAAGRRAVRFEGEYALRLARAPGGASA